MQRRIQALAAERSLPPAEIAKLMRKRVGTRDAVAFMERHHISADWLLTGDLQGRLSMARDAPRARPVFTPDEFVCALSQLNEKERAVIAEYVRILAAQAKLPS